MKILLHTCCGPCSIYPVQLLREQGMDVMAYFYRHNIHPYTECLKRQEALQNYADRAGFRVVRGPLKGLPSNWALRVTMRADCR